MRIVAVQVRELVRLVVDQNEDHAAATKKDLAAAHAKYPKLTIASDPTFAKMKPAFSSDAVPLVMAIDVRTMEIAYSAVGAYERTMDVDVLVQPVIDQRVSY